MLSTQGQFDRERRTATLLAGYNNRPAMKLYQLLHQGEPDARAFEASPLHPVNPVEAVEQLRKFVGRDADTGVAHRQNRSSVPLV